ncbi:MAG: hypothetical protein ACR2HW_06170 [Gemmatimonadales bacterium]
MKRPEVTPLVRRNGPAAEAMPPRRVQVGGFTSRWASGPQYLDGRIDPAAELDIKGDDPELGGNPEMGAAGAKEPRKRGLLGLSRLV